MSDVEAVGYDAIALLLLIEISAACCGDIYFRFLVRAVDEILLEYKWLEILECAASRQEFANR